MATDAAADPLEMIGLPASPPVPASATVDNELRMKPAARLTAAPTTAADRNHPQDWYQRALAAESVTSRMNVLRLAVSNLSPREREETHVLTRHRLPGVDGKNQSAHPAADERVWAASTWSVMVKADQRVVTHAGILYRVIQVGDLRVPVGGISGVTTLGEWRGRGYARAVLANAAAFTAVWLWAPFALVLCPPEDSAFYAKLGWRIAEAPIWCEHAGGRARLADQLAVSLPCQGEVEWPSGPIDLCGAPW